MEDRLERLEQTVSHLARELRKVKLYSSSDHMQNFLDCIRTRKEPNCPVDVAAEAVAGPHLANIALMQKKEAHLPPGYLKV